MIVQALTAVLTALVLNAAAGACTISVPGDFPTIQQAIDAALPGDVVCVDDGVYPEALDLNGLAITLRSVNGPDHTTVDATGLLSSAIYCGTGEGSDTIIHGFTFTGGSGRASTAGVAGGRYGGGMMNEASSPTVIDCIFEDNPVANRGGGMANFGASPTVIRTIFRGHATAFDGGAIYNTSYDGFATDGTDNSRPVFIGCEISDNHIGLLGGLSNHGAGSRNELETLALYANCVFRDNTGIAGVSAFGGAVAAFDTSVVELVNCTIVNNTTQHGGGAVYNGTGATTILTNCIVWANSNTQFHGPGTTLASHSSLQAAHPGTGNIVGDPMLRCIPKGDLRLTPLSPCLDAGDSTVLRAASTGLPSDIETDLDRNGRLADVAGVADTGVPTGMAPVTIDIGAYEFQFDATPTDGNKDGTIDIADLLAVLGKWSSCP